MRIRKYAWFPISLLAFSIFTLLIILIDYSTTAIITATITLLCQFKLTMQMVTWTWTAQFGNYLPCQPQSPTGLNNSFLILCNLQISSFIYFEWVGWPFLDNPIRFFSRLDLPLCFLLCLFLT